MRTPEREERHMPSKRLLQRVWILWPHKRFLHDTGTQVTLSLSVDVD